MSLEDRREQVLNALGQVYEAGGHKSLTMDAVARAAGMSKRTIYGVFADRGAMFIAYFHRVRKHFIRDLSPEDDALPLEDRLRLMLAPRSVGATSLPLDIMRIIITEAPDRPEMAREFLFQVRRHAVAIVASELDRAQARGEIIPCDTTVAAAILMDMLKPSMLELILGGPVSQSLPERQARFDAGLRMAMSGLAP